MKKLIITLALLFCIPAICYAGTDVHGDDVTITNDLSVGATLSVGGAAQFDGNIAVDGTITGGIFTSEGSKSTNDWSATDFSADDTWQNLTISTVLGTGKKFVLLHTGIQNNTAGEYIGFKNPDHANDVNAGWINAVVANVHHYDNIWVETDANGDAKVKVDNDGTWTTINVAVRGYIEVKD